MKIVDPPNTATGGCFLTRRNILRALVTAGVLTPMASVQSNSAVAPGTLLIDDFSEANLVSRLGTRWRAVTDQVMGGASTAVAVRTVIDSRRCLRLTGDVRLDNNGGFAQATLDLSAKMGVLDATPYRSLRLAVRGNDERYSVHLRTSDMSRPWQSFRAHFVATPRWREIELRFDAFVPYRVAALLDLSRLSRLGLVAIGREFQADLAISKIELIA